MTEQHFYAFYYRSDSHIPFYDRTFGDYRNAMKWVEKNKERFAFFTVNCLPKRYWR